MQRPSELSKSVANRLAQLAITEDGAQVLRLLRLTGLFDRQSGPVTDQPASDTANTFSLRPPNPNCIGIWERKQKDGKTFFMRSRERAKEWNNWANVGRIDPKGTKRLVVLIGESVARGYLYDPQYTPAKALEAMLQSRLGKDEVEVVDLARTDLGIEFLELTQSALVLEPDAVVIFAGNNWRTAFSFDPENLSQVRSIATTLREQGVAGLKRFTEEQLSTVARQLVRTVASFYQSKGVPLIWIIPEFNLGDWRDPETNAPHLPDGANLEWITCWEQAHGALRDGNIDAAAEAARKMIELDGGSNPTGFYILARHSQKLGDQDAARRFLEQARDSLIWDTSRGISPRPFFVVQEALRSEIEDGLVDLPSLFKEYLKGGLPDRRLFLDYCHLNSDGIRIAMAAAASRLLRLLNGTDIDWRELADRQIAPSAQLEAEASFLAAIHNAHWWQPQDVIEHYCSRAAQAWPGIGQVMTHFIDLQSRRAPMLMCGSAEQIAGMGVPVVQRYLLRNNMQLLDRSLVDAMVGVSIKLGIDTRRHRKQLWSQEHSVANRTIDLLDPYYCSAALQPQELFWALPTAEKSLFRYYSDYYKAYWFESRFVFIGEADCPTRLRLTCRLPGLGHPEGTISIEVNGEKIGEALIDRDWGTWEIDLADQVVDGLNDVLIRWPIPQFPGKKALEGAADDLVDEVYTEFFPSFGEIHSFTALSGPRP